MSEHLEAFDRDSLIDFLESDAALLYCPDGFIAFRIAIILEINNRRLEIINNEKFTSSWEPWKQGIYFSGSIVGCPDLGSKNCHNYFWDNRCPGREWFCRECGARRYRESVKAWEAEKRRWEKFRNSFHH